MRLTDNLGYKSASLLFAVLVWVGVQSQHRVEERARATVRWTIPEGMAFVEPPLEVVTLTIEGVQALVRTVPQRTLTMEVDLAKASAGDVSIDLGQRPVSGLPDQLNVTSVSPALLRLTLDRLLKRRVPVMPATVGKVAEGYRVAAVKVTPDRAEIEGAATLLRSVESVPSGEADIGGLRDDQDIEVGLGLRKGLVATRQARYVVHVDVEPIIVERQFDFVPVVVQSAGWTSVSPAVSLVLTGPQEAIDAVGAGAVSVVVTVPPGRTGSVAEARRTRGEGVRYEVLHGAGETVRVVSVEPATLKLQRDPSP
ncbi:MAG: YbbR-like domain-containing protein [Myxococcales bacterium]|nr:YbbR-like domain-containing protein [Myxococcales bacterium]